MFHSSGTASGKVEVMNRWKHTISAAARIVTVGLVESSRTNGVTISTKVPPTWASSLARCDGRRSCGRST